MSSYICPKVTSGGTLCYIKITVVKVTVCMNSWLFKTSKMEGPITRESQEESRKGVRFVHD